MKTDIVISIATYLRPVELARCLRSVDAQVVARKFGIAIVDNDPNASARPVFESFVGTTHHPIQYVVEPTPGIAAARNRGVALAAAAGATWVVFIDDDEVATNGWLQALVDAASQFGADLVAGPVHAIVEPGGSSWVRPKDYHQLVPERGARMAVASTANLLVRVSVLSHLSTGAGPFDNERGLLGDEDTYMTARATRAGFMIVATSDAIANEFIPPNRQNLGWLRRRRRRQAAAYAAVQRSILREPYWLARRLAAAAKHLSVGVALFTVGTVCRSSRPRNLGLTLIARANGTLLGLLGHTVAEYSRDEH
jgi:succinoglycan biosynthesis protein ExoM